MKPSMSVPLRGSGSRSILRLTVGLLAALAALLPLWAPAADEAPHDSAEKFYAKLGGGAFFLDLPESSPFIRTNGAEEAVALLEHYDPSYRVGPFVVLEFGGEYEAFGRSLATEVRIFHTSRDSKHVSDYRSPTEPWTNILDSFMESFCPGKSTEDCPLTPAGERALVSLIKDDPDVRSVGWIGAIDGKALEFGTPNFAWGDPIRITTERDVTFWGVDVVGAFPISLDGHRKISLVTGPSFKRLRQAADVFAYESNRNPNVNHMMLKEDLRASYIGGLVGVRLEFPFKENWHFRIDGTAGGYYLDSRYEGHQRTFLSSGNPAVDVTAEPKSNDSGLAMSLNVHSSLSVTVFGNLTLQAGAGVEYLSRTPVVRYASLGESFRAGVDHAPARIAHSRASGILGTISITHVF